MKCKKDGGLCSVGGYCDKCPARGNDMSITIEEDCKNRTHFLMHYYGIDNGDVLYREMLSASKSSQHEELESLRAQLAEKDAILTVLNAVSRLTINGEISITPYTATEEMKNAGGEVILRFLEEGEGSGLTPGEWAEGVFGEMKNVIRDKVQGSHVFSLPTTTGELGRRLAEAQAEIKRLKCNPASDLSGLITGLRAEIERMRPVVMKGLYYLHNRDKDCADSPYADLMDTLREYEAKVQK